MDRARQRYTLLYRFHPRFQAGIEYNPVGDGDVGLLANWVAFSETATRPALIFGTSSDRIGTTDGRAVYATLSKDIKNATGLPLAPYIGTAYGGFDHDWEVVGGLRVRYDERISSLHLWDGENLHHVLSSSFGSRYSGGVVLAEQDGDYFLGLTFGVEFDLW